jgi:hypothetical protein
MNSQRPVQPKSGARFHFELPGSVQGFYVQAEAGQALIENVGGHSREGQRSLRISNSGSGSARVVTGTFIHPDDLGMKGYELVGSPALYSGQQLHAGIRADENNHGPVDVRLGIAYYDANDEPQWIVSSPVSLPSGDYQDLLWTIPELEGLPIYAVGLEITGEGNQYLDYLTWDGEPKTVFQKPRKSESPRPGPNLWRMGWVNAVDDWLIWYHDSFRIVHNQGRGMVITGTRQWKDYRVSAKLRPTLLKAGGLAARVQGLCRFYALQLAAVGKFNW